MGHKEVRDIVPFGFRDQRSESEKIKEKIQEELSLIYPNIEFY